MAPRDPVLEEDTPHDVVLQRRRALERGLGLGALAAVVLAVLRPSSPTGWLAVLLAAVAGATLLLLRTDRLPLRRAQQLVLPTIVLPVLAHHAALALVDPVDDAAAGMALLLRALQVGVGLAAATHLLLPAARARATGAATVLAAHAVLLVRPEVLRLPGVGPRAAASVAVGLAVVFVLDVLASSSSLLLDATRTTRLQLAGRRRMQAMAAHDLRSPLSVASGAVQTLAEHQERLDTDQLIDLTRVADDAIQRAVALSDDLLVESSGADVAGARATFLLDDAVAAAVAASRLPSGDVVVAGCDREVVADRRRLERILVNLLDNAHKHGRPPVTVTCSVDRDNWRVAVEDSGPGVRPQLLPDVFEAYTRDEDEPAADGIGLGLHIVQAFAGSLGGVVTADTGASGGARFVLTVPRSPAPVA